MDMRELQRAIYQNKVNKGFNLTDIQLEFCSLYGEVSEDYNAWRRKQDSVGEELADVAIFTLGLAEMLGLDLQSEIERKMAINRKRAYDVVDGVFQRIADAEEESRHDD